MYIYIYIYIYLYQKNKYIYDPSPRPQTVVSGGIWVGGIWEASGRHLGGLWELGQPGGPRIDVEEKFAKTIVFYHGKLRVRPFRVDETSVGVTISATYAQKIATVTPLPTPARIYRRLRQTARTPQCKHCLGNIENMQKMKYIGVRGSPYGNISSLHALPWARPAERILPPLSSSPPSPSPPPASGKI